MVLPAKIAAKIMADADRGFRVPVWKYTYATGKAAGEIFLYSPKVDGAASRKLVLRQINSEAENKVWVADDPSQFKRCDDSSEEIFDDAHGVLLRDGWAQKLHEDESAGSVSFKRGNRVWIERNLTPGQTDLTKLPVVDLDTLSSFEVPIADICFIAQLAKTEDEEHFLAVAVGPVVNYYVPKRKRMAQLYMVWPEEEPERTQQVWEVWEREDKRSPPKLRATEYRRLAVYEEQWQIFRLQWSYLNRRFITQEKDNGTEPCSQEPPSVQETSSQAETSDEYDSDITDCSSSSGELGLHWEPGPINKTNCCNLSPKCPLKPGEADLVPSYIGGLQEIEHYHIQDEDIDECPEGANHKSHCVLRNNRTQCVFSHDQIQHTCCKLRTSRLLPGVGATVGDLNVLPWEKPLSDDYFVDFAEKVQVRTDLDLDRDAVPSALQNMLKSVHQRKAELKREHKSLNRILLVPRRRRQSRQHPYERQREPPAAQSSGVDADALKAVHEQVEPTPLAQTNSHMISKQAEGVTGDADTGTTRGVIVHQQEQCTQHQPQEQPQQQYQCEDQEHHPQPEKEPEPQRNLPFFQEQGQGDQEQQGQQGQWQLQEGYQEQHPQSYQQQEQEQQQQPFSMQYNFGDSSAASFYDQLPRLNVPNPTFIEPTNMADTTYVPYNMAVSPSTFWNNLSTPVILPDSSPVPFVPAVAITSSSMLTNLNGPGSQPGPECDDYSLYAFEDPRWYTGGDQI